MAQGGDWRSEVGGEKAFFEEGQIRVIQFRTEKGIVRGIPLWAGDVIDLKPGYTIQTTFPSPFWDKKRVRFILVEDFV